MRDLKGGSVPNLVPTPALPLKPLPRPVQRRQGISPFGRCPTCFSKCNGEQASRAQWAFVGCCVTLDFIDLIREGHC
jgi:hypothetical protein